MRQSSTKPLPLIPIGGNLLSRCVIETSTSYSHWRQFAITLSGRLPYSVNYKPLFVKYSAYRILWLAPCDKIAQNRVLWLFFKCLKCPFSTLELSPCDNYRPVTIFWLCPEVVTISDKYCILIFIVHVGSSLHLGSYFPSQLTRNLTGFTDRVRQVNWPIESLSFT